ncbi:MAG: hypothetical protein AB8G95_25460 [Anaerolineae bacterium]
MTQIRTSDPEYWTASSFKVTDSDIENLYQHLIDTEEPQKLDTLVRAIIVARIGAEKLDLQRRLEGRTVYQPLRSYAVGDQIIFPSMQFAHGEVANIRDAQNPQYGEFKSIEVNFTAGRSKEFASELDIDHPLNTGDGLSSLQSDEPDVEKLVAFYGDVVSDALVDRLNGHEEFIRLADQWFIKSLFSDVNVGHLHLAEAILDMNAGGPLTTPQILVDLDMDSGVKPSVQEFSLNYHLQQDERFVEVAPPGRVMWFLHRLTPADVQSVPERLQYETISFDRALFGSQLLQIEREIDDEWSELESADLKQTVKITITYPHLVSGTLPLSSRVRPLFPLGVSQTQLVTLIDDMTGQEFNAWVAGKNRYITGLEDWFERNSIPVGGYINLTPTDQPGRVIIGCDRRRKERKEYVRLASIEEGRVKFELRKKNIGCDYDDLMIVGTDQVAALDAIYRKSSQRSLNELLAEIFPDLTRESAQSTVHAKTLYSAINMLRRVPSGVVFAELVRHPAFISVGDQYWQFDSKRIQ